MLDSGRDKENSISVSLLHSSSSFHVWNFCLLQVQGLKTGVGFCSSLERPHKKSRWRRTGPYLPSQMGNLTEEEEATGLLLLSGRAYN